MTKGCQNQGFSYLHRLGQWVKKSFFNVMGFVKFTSKKTFKIFANVSKMNTSVTKLKMQRILRKQKKAKRRQFIINTLLSLENSKMKEKNLKSIEDYHLQAQIPIKSKKTNKYQNKTQQKNYCKLKNLSKCKADPKSLIQFPKQASDINSRPICLNPFRYDELSDFSSNKINKPINQKNLISNLIPSHSIVSNNNQLGLKNIILQVSKQQQFPNRRIFPDQYYDFNPDSIEKVNKQDFNQNQLIRNHKTKYLQKLKIKSKFIQQNSNLTVMKFCQNHEKAPQTPLISQNLAQIVEMNNESGQQNLQQIRDESENVKEETKLVKMVQEWYLPEYSLHQISDQNKNIFDESISQIASQSSRHSLLSFKQEVAPLLPENNSWYLTFFKKFNLRPDGKGIISQIPQNQYPFGRPVKQKLPHFFKPKASSKYQMIVL